MTGCQVWEGMETWRMLGSYKSREGPFSNS